MEPEALSRAASEFMRLHSDYQDTEQNFALMCAVIERQGLSPTSVSDLGRAWSFVKKVTANDPVAAAPVRARQETVIPAPVAPAPAEPADPIETEARRLIDSGEVTNAIVHRLSAKELESRCRNLAFARALEILEAQKVRMPDLSRGDLAVAYGRATQHGTNLDEEIARAASRPAPVPVSQPLPSTGRGAGVLNLNRAQGFAKPLPSLQTCLKNEKADHEWLEEQRTKSARATRVRANRNR